MDVPQVDDVENTPLEEKRVRRALKVMLLMLAFVSTLALLRIGEVVYLMLTKPLS
jgi:hypothetical protein